MSIEKEVVENCTNCKGTGTQVFHGPFASFRGRCNFCRGTGKRIDQRKWLQENCQQRRNEINRGN